MFKKIFDVIASFFKWIFSIFTGDKVSKMDSEGKSTKKKKKKVETILKEAGISKKPKDIKKSDSQLIKDKLVQLKKKKQPKEESEVVEKEAQEISSNLTKTFKLNGYSESEIFHPKFKGSEILQRKGDIERAIVDIRNLIQNMTLEYFQLEGALKKGIDTEKIKPNDAFKLYMPNTYSIVSKKEKDSKDIDIDLETMYGTLNPKKYEYTVAQIIELVPEVILYASVGEVIKEETKNLKEIEKRFKTKVFDTFNENDFNNYDREEIKQCIVRVLRDTQHMITETIKYVMSTLSEYTKIRNTTLKAHLIVNKTIKRFDDMTLINEKTGDIIRKGSYTKEYERTEP